MSGKRPKQSQAEPDPPEVEVVAETEWEDDSDSESELDDDDALVGEVVASDTTVDSDTPPAPGQVPPLAAHVAGGRDSKAPGPLARYDPLQAYMRDVQRYKLLTPEEEKAAALAYYEDGDVEAAAKLVTANLRLVVKIAYDYRRAHKNLNDLIQEGSIGLMQAVKKYDPYKGVKLSTYAAWWIRAYILRFILNNARLVKLGTTQAQRKLFFNLKKEKAKLSAMGIEPTPDAIAKRLKVSKEEVVQMDRRLTAGDMSLNAPVHADESGSATRMDLLPSSAERVDEELAEAEADSILHEKLHEFGETLSGKDAVIYQQRMLADEPRTLQELGDEFGISRERVRQLEKRLQMRLREYLAAELGETLADISPP